MNTKICLLIAIAFFSASCSQIQTTPDIPIQMETEFAGIYQQGEEMSLFRKCGSQEKWWVNTKSKSIREKMQESVGEKMTEMLERRKRYGDEFKYPEFFVRVKGLVSEKGHFGHLGQYDREFEITELIEIRSFAGNECNS